MMRTKLSSWLRGKLDRYRRRRRSRAISDNAELPWLPDRRPRPLTPTAAAPGSGSGSGSSSSSGILQQHAQDGSLVFSKLPFDVRRLILELAFGKTVLHMDLSFGHPVAALERGTATPRSHCGLNVTSPKQHPTDLRLDRGLPERWQWWSSRCHCILPADKWHSSVGKPWEDHCHTGTGHYCDDWPGERPSKCQIGIMGWLLACRQAYTEGVDILYGSNTLRIASEPLLRHMPTLLLPQRLATITSLEISWPLAITAVGDHRALHPGHLEMLLDLLSAHFHRLSRLTLSLEMDHFVGAAPRPQDLLATVSAFVHRTGPRLRKCAIALPWNMYMSHVDLLARPALAAYCNGLSPEHVLEHPVVWRTLDGRFALRSYRTAEFLVPPEDMTLEDCHPDMPGFWVVEGKDDSPSIRPTSCTGGNGHWL